MSRSVNSIRLVIGTFVPSSVVLLALTAIGCGDDVSEDSEQISVSSAGQDLSDSPNGKNPDGVPPDFVAVPGGFVHPSCVIELAPDEYVDGDEIVGLEDHHPRKKIRDCQYPHYDQRGRMRERERDIGLAPPAINGWIESAWTIEPTTWMYSNFSVPNKPLQSGALVYLFPGLQDGNRILQPVLRSWKGKWTIACWNVDSSNNYVKSRNIAAAAGDRVLGMIAGSSCNSSGVCRSWEVFAENLTSGANTDLDNIQGLTRAFSDVQGGALEAYYLDSCRELPRSYGIEFNTRINGPNTNVYWPEWNYWVGSGNPSCAYGGYNTGSPNKARLLWWPND